MVMAAAGSLIGGWDGRGGTSTDRRLDQAAAMTKGAWLRRVSESRSGAEGQDDYDVIVGDGFVIGRIFKATASPAGMPWRWALVYGQHEDRTPTHGYEATREAAMSAFAKSWRRE